MLGLTLSLLIGLAGGPPIRTVTKPLAAQLDPLRFMIGEWKAAANGAGAGGESSIEPDLNGHVLVRRDHVLTKAGTAFDIYMMIYPDVSGLRAEYVDTEGHTIHYAATPGDGSSVRFDAPGSGRAPGYRLTYVAVGADRLHIRFEIAPPGGAYAVYSEGDMARTWPPHTRRH